MNGDSEIAVVSDETAGDRENDLARVKVQESGHSDVRRVPSAWSGDTDFSAHAVSNRGSALWSQ